MVAVTCTVRVRSSVNEQNVEIMTCMYEGERTSWGDREGEGGGEDGRGRDRMELIHTGQTYKPIVMSLLIECGRIVNGSCSSEGGDQSEWQL